MLYAVPDDLIAYFVSAWAFIFKVVSFYKYFNCPCIWSKKMCMHHVVLLFYPFGFSDYYSFLTISCIIQIGKGKVLVEGKHVALLGYGSMVQNCLRAQSILAELGVYVTVADARFCKPLDIDLIRNLCDDHSFLITVEEGAIGGFGSRVAQFLSLDGQLDAGIKVNITDNLCIN